MSFVIPEEVKRVQELFIEGKKKEAFSMLDGFSIKDFSLQFYRGLFYLFQGDFKRTQEIADKIFEENKKVKNYFYLFDALVLKWSSLFSLSKYNQLGEMIALGENFLKLAPKTPKYEIKIREIELSTWKAIILGFIKGDFDLAIEISNNIINFLEQNDRTLGFYYATNLLIIAYSHFMEGELNKALVEFEQFLGSEFPKRNPGAIASITMAMGLTTTGEIHFQKGNLDQAIKNFEKGLKLYEMGNETYFIAWTFYSIIKVLLVKKSLKLAKNYLHRFHNFCIQNRGTRISYVYQLSKASILKESSRFHDKVEAVNILKDLNKQNTGYRVTTHTSISLCELLITELQMTNEITILDEIKPIIARLLEIAEAQRAYALLTEVNLLQAKLSLLVFDIKSSQRFLTQAQRIAERYSLNHLTTKITNESEDLLKKLDLWERLKASGAPIAERLELARLDEKIVGMVFKNTLPFTPLTEEKVTISKETKICLVCRGEVLRFSYICECGANYCGNCAQALTNMENVCWACEIPIDYLKPVKSYKNEERIYIEDKAKKI
jgi:tetratricopeptide (TPR) repeat protein